MKIPAVILLSLVAIFGQVAGCGNTPGDSDVILLPQGYVGRVRIDYGAKGAEPLAKRKGGWLYLIPASGYLKTSSSLPQAMGSENFEAVKGSSRIPLDVEATIWEDSIGGAVMEKQKFKPTERTFFVGTQAESELAGQFCNFIGPIDRAALRAWKSGRDLSYRELAGRNFARANLTGANIQSSGLKRANLQSANLAYAVLASDFTEANLRGANLYGASLAESTFAGADLRGCDLRKARLQRADLSGSRLQGADLRGAEYDASTRWPRGLGAQARGAVVRTLIAE